MYTGKFTVSLKSIAFELFTVGGGIDMLLSALKELFSGVDFISIDAVLT